MESLSQLLFGIQRLHCLRWTISWLWQDPANERTPLISLTKAIDAAAIP
jgi:hypothetical protein